ncbi:MAG: hypothetical protein ACOCUR_02970 [Nanoarchaeota archaeon]
MDKQEISEKLYDGYLRCTAIFEMVGKPKEHVDKTLHDYMEQIKKAETVEVISEDFAEPTAVEGEMFSSFVETEFLVKDSASLVWFCFDYLPSSIEIIEPEQIKYRSVDFTSFLNDLQSRLHQFDMSVKTVSEENKKISRNTENLLKNAIKLAIGSGKTTVDKISPALGIPVEDLEKIMNSLVEANLIVKENDSFSLKN